ncbi:MAG: GlmU family protein [Chitinophagales bacterium]|nr:GlmU family protein [Chitinophagales bacterium]
MKLPNLILFDDAIIRGNLLPFTFSRPVADTRIGILTIREKWEHATENTASVLTENYLSKKYPLKKAATNLLVNASVLPDENLIKEIAALKVGESLVKEDVVIATVSKEVSLEKIASNKKKEYRNAIVQIKHPWDIFSKNEIAITADFNAIIKGRKSQKIDSTNHVLGKNIFIEKGAKVSCSVLNATAGAIYIGKDAEVMEGSLIRGPFALCEHSTLKLGSKIYGATTIGPHCKVGGEVNNSVIFGYSNKAHDGFLGNSVIGEWCNIGADSNNSNLKNNYANVKLWHYPKVNFVDTGLQFCGLFMGDHSRCGINTMFNTGTVAGFSANIFGAGFPRNFIPSFSWGGAHGFSTYSLQKAMETAERVMQRRGLKLDATEKEIWKSIFEETEKYRIRNAD